MRKAGDGDTGSESAKPQVIVEVLSLDTAQVFSYTPFAFRT